jgi:hypothetical protein
LSHRTVTYDIYNTNVWPYLRAPNSGYFLDSAAGSLQSTHKKRNVDNNKSFKMKIESNNKKPKVSKDQPFRHKYSFDATLKRSIPVVNAEEQVRIFKEAYLCIKMK